MTDPRHPAPDLPALGQTKAQLELGSLVAARLELRGIIAALKDWQTAGGPIAARKSQDAELLGRLNAVAAELARGAGGATTLRTILHEEMRSLDLPVDWIVRTVRTGQRYGRPARARPGGRR